MEVKQNSPNYLFQVFDTKVTGIQDFILEMAISLEPNHRNECKLATYGDKSLSNP